MLESPVLQKQAYTIESQSKSSWISSGGKERRIWKAWEGIMCCWFMAPWWPRKKKSVSAGTWGGKSGREQLAPRACCMCQGMPGTATLPRIHQKPSTKLEEQSCSSSSYFLVRRIGLKKLNKTPGIHTYILNTQRRQRQKDHGFKTSLGYTDWIQTHRFKPSPSESKNNSILFY